MDWDEYFMKQAELVASKSKDTSTKVGAVLTRHNNGFSTGYNGFPRGVNDNIPERHERPAKYDWTVHSELNCLLNAGREGFSTYGTTMYVTLHPCKECAKAIVQAGVKRVVYLSDDNPRFDFALAKIILNEGKVICEKYGEPYEPMWHPV
jgi:dCMP deaminase